MPFQIKANDRKPSIQTTLGFQGSSAVPILAGATVNFIMSKNTGTDTAPVPSPQPKVNAPCVVVDAATAVVRYDWKPGDTDTPGKYLVEWEVVGSDGLTQTFPTATYDDLVIYQDLDRAA